jgi:predicted DNA-binding transcriptional regulator YafY
VSRPTSRVLTLLELLQSGGVRTLAELADRLDVDERTVRRYVHHLIDLGVPVDSLRGRYGGYKLSPGYRVPPLMLTDDEGLAVLLGLIAGRRSGLFATSATASETATAKVRRVLPARVAHRLDALLDSLAFTSTPSESETPDSDILLTVADAVQHRRPISFRYITREGGRRLRTLHAFGLVSHSGRWYVTGFDPGVGEERTFRLDRIEDARTLPGTFQRPAKHNAPKRVLSTLATAPYQHEVTLRILGTVEDIRTRLPASIAILEELPSMSGNPDGGGWQRVELHVERLDWLPAVLASLDLPFVIERPDELRDLVVGLADRLATSAQGRSPHK